MGGHMFAKIKNTDKDQSVTSEAVWNSDWSAECDKAEKECLSPEREKERLKDLVCQAGIRIILRQICNISDNDPSTKETPRRVVAALKEMTQGYKQNPKQILSTAFEESDCDEIVIVRDIPFVSLCEHHLLPFVGTVDIGYLPSKVSKKWVDDSDPLKAMSEVMGEGPSRYRIVGLSKLARLVDCFAQRLQLQERLTTLIANAIMDEPLKAQGVIIVVNAQHACMGCRGVKKPNTTMTTSCCLGVMRDDNTARQEFLMLCNS
jgi:GTP cyclohydrolase I